MLDTASGLANWTPEAKPFRELTESATARPGFPVAMRTLAANMMQARSSSSELRRLFKDAGHYVAAMLAVYLHLTGGLTMPNLKLFCARTGFLSPGRARAVLLYMQYCGFVEPIASLRQGKSAQWRVRQSVIDAWLVHLRQALEAAALVESEARLILDRFDDPAVAQAFAVIHSEILQVAAKATPGEIATINAHFMQRRAGSAVLSTIIAGQDARAFQAREPFNLPIVATARNFGVTRLHLRRMIRDAREAGLLVDRPDGALSFTAQAHKELCALYSGQIVCLLEAAAKTAIAQSHNPMMNR